MKLLFVIILFLSFFQSCSHKDEYIFSSDVKETVNRLFPVKPININQNSNTSDYNDSLKLINTLNELLMWIGSDDFITSYKTFQSSKSYTIIDNKLASIVRNNGFSSYKDFGFSLANNQKLEVVKQLNDSLKSTTFDRIKKINKELSEKNK